MADGSYRGVGGGVSAANMPVSKDNLSSQIEMVDREIDRLVGLRDSLCSFADRITGTKPRDAGVNEAVPPAVSIVDDLGRKRRRLASLLSECETECHRIGQAIG